MDVNNIFAYHVDFEIIKAFQKLDPGYCVQKFEKLEQRFTTPSQNNIPIIVTTKPSKTMTVTKIETKMFIDENDE